MAVRMDKAWVPLDSAHVAKMTGHLGVYQLADTSGEIVYIGVAGGRSRFGLKGELQGELQACLAAPPQSAGSASQFRVEINMMYHSRHRELLQAYVHDYGALPTGNGDVDLATLGRIRPYG